MYLLEQKYAFLDIETSGLDPVKHEPIEVAYILMPGGTCMNFSLAFDEERADPEALRINGWRRRKFGPVKEDRAAVRTLIHDLSRVTVIGNNVSFDLSFLTEYLRRQGVQPHYLRPWNYASVELRSMVGGFFKVPPPWSTRDLVHRLGVPPRGDDEHTALGDAQWNKEVYERLMESGK